MTKRALLSVYRKEGIVDLARGLAERGFEILSTGGTAAELGKAEVKVTGVSKATGFPEILDGRVKTLHPGIHAGILARRDAPEHTAALEKHKIAPIDVVVVNLYPFEEKVAKGCTFEEAVENVDIGGPTMVRAAAKNFRHVAVVVDPADYGLLLEQLDRDAGIDAATRLYLAQKAFRHTGRYEAAIAGYFSQVEEREGAYVPAEADETFPYRLSLTFEKVQDLRYGENPHQRAAFYSDLGSTLYSVAAARKMQGKELSFNNILDLDAAWRLATEIDDPACVIVKHTNPCGTGTGASPLEAYERAWACDPTSAFGGIIAFNERVDAATARKVTGQFVEAVIAPGFEGEALKVLGKKTNLRVMNMDTTGIHKASGFDLRRVMGGLLAQQWDLHRLERDRCEVVTKRVPSEEEWKALLFAWTVVKHVKSNAIVFANAVQTVGVGAGQMSRVDSARIAAQKAVLPLAGTVVASDAFFPFRDGIDEIAKTGADRDRPAGRLRPRRGDDRRRRRARPRHGLHRRPSLPALTPDPREARVDLAAPVPPTKAGGASPFRSAREGGGRSAQPLECRPEATLAARTAASTSAGAACAVPTFPTTTPAAQLARAAASGRLAPAARARASVAITVSPAPVTSNTSRAAASTCTGGRPFSKRLMPCSPRVTRTARQPRSERTRRPAARRSPGPRTRSPVACSVSSWLGVTTVTPRYWRKWRTLGSTSTGTRRRRARGRTRLSSEAVTTPFS